MPSAKNPGLSARNLRTVRSAVKSRNNPDPPLRDSSPPVSDYEAASTGRPAKRRKTASDTPTRGGKKVDPYRYLFTRDADFHTIEACAPPTRQHAVAYHRPLLLDKESGRDGRRKLLTWFDSVSSTRSMPWRKQWIDPSTVSDASELRKIHERRAYEVWISEIMLQQTRVAVVIDYWNRWMDKWPTIQDLAAASSDDVLAAWRGLGYYSRAARIHEGAKLVVSDAQMDGLLPYAAADLESKIPGVGPYTAGAISAIVYGRAEPMVDGNVLRVLSRQLGLRSDIKADKTVIDTIWVAADALAKAVSRDGHDKIVSDDTVSDRPGRWGQALMELGSTICAPKPNCGECPITSTCRVYAEGQLLAERTEAVVMDVEDLCSLCEPLEEDELLDQGTHEEGAAKTKKTKPPPKKLSTLEAFGFSSANKSSLPKKPSTSEDAMNTITNYARKFPLKIIKKAVRQEEILVCAVRRDDGHYLIHRRPLKGLLAGLWELPSHSLGTTGETKAKTHRSKAQDFVSGLFKDDGVDQKLNYVKDLGTVPWLFSHLMLTMHVHLFEMEGTGNFDVSLPDSSEKLARWSDNVEDESMGTGMRKCWALVKDME